MDPVVQWGIATLVSILTFFGGRAFERRRISNINRIKLLEPIEQWVDKASRIIGIVGDDISTIAQGLPFPVGYSPQERIDASRAMGETKEKVLGIISSKALSTRGTRALVSKLKDRILTLSNIIEREYFQTHIRMLDKMNLGKDLSSEIESLLQLAVISNLLIQDIHQILSELKTKYS